MLDLTAFLCEPSKVDPKILDRPDSACNHFYENREVHILAAKLVLSLHYVMRLRSAHIGSIDQEHFFVRGGNMIPEMCEALTLRNTRARKASNRDDDFVPSKASPAKQSELRQLLLFIGISVSTDRKNNRDVITSVKNAHNLDYVRKHWPLYEQICQNQLHTIRCSPIPEVVKVFMPSAVTIPKPNVEEASSVNAIEDNVEPHSVVSKPQDQEQEEEFDFSKFIQEDEVPTFVEEEHIVDQSEYSPFFEEVTLPEQQRLTSTNIATQEPQVIQSLRRSSTMTSNGLGFKVLRPQAGDEELGCMEFVRVMRQMFQTQFPNISRIPPAELDLYLSFCPDMSDNTVLSELGSHAMRKVMLNMFREKFPHVSKVSEEELKMFRHYYQ
jgi:hypothetical protein